MLGVWMSFWNSFLHYFFSIDSYSSSYCCTNSAAHYGTFLTSEFGANNCSYRTSCSSSDSRILHGIICNSGSGTYS